MRKIFGVTIMALLFVSGCELMKLEDKAADESGKNMIGRQSQNEGILVLPAKDKVTVDGNLDDWDLSGRIWVFADKNVRNRFSTEVSAMWTASDLYVVIKWKDPTPMYSMIDPEFNENDGWKSDSVQLRLWTPDQTSWITTWFFAGKKQPVMHISVWKDPRNCRNGQDNTVLVAKPGETDLGQGAEMAYKVDADGKGYVQEIKIPWKFIYKNPPEMNAGATFRMGMEFLWGDPTGKVWPIHRYADNMQPGMTSREFYWSGSSLWGDAKLVDKGNVPVRKYVEAGAKLAGTVPIRLTLPKDIASFTIVIEDSAGNTIRTMGGLDPNDYTIEEKGDRRIVEVLWDGLTDKIWSGNHRDGFSGSGKLVQPGTYKVRGLYHKGLSSAYEMCFYNPGTPPWPTVDGSGAWGADHAKPLCVASAGDWMIASWAFAEGGSGIIGIGPDGKKKWGEKRGGLFIAADQNYVYAIPAGWHLKKEVLIRLDKKAGAYKPFELNGKALPFEMPIADILKGKENGTVTGIAVHGNTLALALLEQKPGEVISKPEEVGKDGNKPSGPGMIAIIDSNTAQLKKLLKMPSPSCPTFDSKGNLYALINGKPAKINQVSGKTEFLQTPGLGKAAAMTTDHDNNILIADVGNDMQVKAYSPDGKLIYTCGQKGGRPIRGKFNPEAMIDMASVAVDSKGQIWVTESWDFPRRISVWGKNGKLVRDYIGNTGYAGTGCYLHDQDPNLAYIGPIEVKLDKKTRSWKVTQILWVPDETKGESFEILTGSHNHPQRFRSKVSGKMREYLYAHDAREGGGNVVYMETDGKWRPVAAVCLVGHISGKIDRSGMIIKEPDGEMAGLNPFDVVFWNDKNKDGKVQRSECEIVKTKSPGKLNAKHHNDRGRPAIDLNNGWGGRMGTDLVFYLNGINKMKPVGFSDDGAPIYTSKSIQPVGYTDNGDLVPVPEEDLLVSLSWKGYAGPTNIAGIDTKTGKLRWTYPNPYPGVHGSHRATMPKPGLIIGPLKVLGAVEVNKEVGRIFAMRGNLGQDFFMTTDGVFIGTMFEDGRLPGMTLPNKEEQLDGVPMEGFSNGGEPFNGCLVRQEDGKVRMTTGFPRQAAMILEVNGLDTIKRFKGEPIKLDKKMLAKIDADNVKRAEAASQAGAKNYVIKKLGTAPKIDGNSNDWKDIPKVKISRAGSPETGTGRLAYDAEKLYIFFEVNDKSTWMNEGKDFSRLFKTGDSVDVQLSPSGNKGRDPKAGDFRIVIANVDRKPTAVLMEPIAKGGATAAKSYTSPVGTKKFDRVEIIKDAVIKVNTGGGRYSVEAAIPLTSIGLKPSGKMSGDVGFISSDSAGKINSARTYWSNKKTNLVNDEPIEAWLDPQEWGEFVFE